MTGIVAFIAGLLVLTVAGLYLARRSLHRHDEEGPP